MFNLVKQIAENIFSMFQKVKMQTACCNTHVCVKIEPSISVYSVGSSPSRLVHQSSQIPEPD